MNEQPPVIDFHTHILPQLDHGCRDVATCSAQLELMARNGTAVAVATSHFYPHIHSVEQFTERSRRAVELMRSATVEAAPRILLGSEVLICRQIDEMKDIDKLCIDDTSVLLAELPSQSLKREYVDTVEALLKKGLNVVLAHIDRYLSTASDLIDEMLALGAKAQINADALLSPRSRKRLFGYIENGSVCALGSDLHGADGSGYKAFAKAEKHLHEYYFEIMRRSAELLRGASVTELNN